MSEVYYDTNVKQFYDYQKVYFEPEYPGAGIPTPGYSIEKVYLPAPEKIIERIVEQVEEVKVPTMPVLAGFEKMITEQLDTLATGLKGVAQPIIYTETPQGVKEINWKAILPIIAIVGLLIFGGK
ncbi:hypothetical protein ES702_05954 [subsurface metagenome]